MTEPSREATDLAPTLKDAYLRKAAFGRGCETVELTFHVLRRAIGPRESDRDRLLGFRFKEVRGIGTEAVRWDRDAARWVAAKMDWLGALGRDQLEHPIVGTILLDSPASFERWTKSAPDMLWLRGKPEDLAGGAYLDAPAVFEMTCEVVLPNGWNANGRIFVAAGSLEIAGSKGPLDVGQVLRLGAEWQGKWMDYWSKKARGRITVEDPQYEWSEPEGA